MAHTPAPWVIDDTRVHTAINAGDKHVAMVNYFISPVVEERISEEEHLANARLIEAAPDLLKMCAIAFSALKSYQYGNSSPELAEEVAAEIEVLINKIRR